VEREKGGVKLFVGRLPREANQRAVRECFEEFGEVLEVFVIDSKAASGLGCAFVRMASIEAAEKAIADLHEQRVLIPEHRDMGPMQVAFAKGEALRLGIDEKEEILPSFREARQKVVEHQEKKMFFEAMSKQQEMHQQALAYQQAVGQQQQMMAQQVGMMPKDKLVTLIKAGQRSGGQPFKRRWWSFCDQGFGGTRDYDPSHHPAEALAHFTQMATFEFAVESWFRKFFGDLPDLPPAPPLAPGPPPPGMPGPPGMMPLPGMVSAPPGAPCGMPPPGFPGGPPMAPGFPPGFPGVPGPSGMLPGAPMPALENGDSRVVDKAQESSSSSSSSSSESGDMEDIDLDEI